MAHDAARARRDRVRLRRGHRPVGACGRGLDDVPRRARERRRAPPRRPDVPGGGPAPRRRRGRRRAPRDRGALAARPRRAPRAAADRLRQEDIHVTAATRADRLTRVADFAPPWPARIKRASLAAISQALPPTSAALLTGLLLGERTALPSELDEGFRRAGVYHVLAVSGFNVALLAGATLALCRLARVGRRPSAVAAIVVVVGFAAVVGPEPSVPPARL